MVRADRVSRETPHPRSSKPFEGTVPPSPAEVVTLHDLSGTCGHSRSTLGYPTRSIGAPESCVTRAQLCDSVPTSRRTMSQVARQPTVVLCSRRRSRVQRLQLLKNDQTTGSDEAPVE